MTDKKVWFITGAGRGMGVDIAKAAVAAGNAVVATARSTDTIGAALGQNEDLLAVKLDVTDPANAEVSVRAAMSRFGRIDVLVNNASSSRGRSRVRGLIPTARAWRRERRSPRTSRRALARHAAIPRRCRRPSRCRSIAGCLLLPIDPDVALALATALRTRIGQRP